MKVVYAPTASRQVREIWNWNERTYSAEHAEEYVQFLKQHMDGLAENHWRGTPIENWPNHKYLRIRRKARGHGHVAIYRVDETEVHVLFVFHSAQDWREKLRKRNS